MTLHYRKKMLIVPVLAVMLGSTSAMAFDETSWNWQKNINENIEINVNIESNLDPAGHVEIASDQIHTGSVNALVEFDGNYQSNDGAGSVAINQETLDELNSGIPIAGSFADTDPLGQTSDVSNFEGEF